jgi:hypothetical protein
LLDETAGRNERAAMMGKITEYLVVCIFILTLVAYEWMHWHFNWRTRPVVFSILGVCLTGYAAVRIGFMIPRLRLLKMERESRDHLRSVLKSLASSGFYLFDQVVDAQGRFIGSVLLGERGVFTVTARFVSRPGVPFESITSGAEGRLRAGDHEILADPLGQARRSASLLYGLLARENLETVAVQPLLVFPGWKIGGIEQDGAEEVRIVNEKSLGEEIPQLPRTVEPGTVIRLCQAMDRWSVGARTAAAL